MDQETLGIIGVIVVLLIFVFPRLLPGKPKQRTCPHCKSKIDYNANVCPFCKRSSQIGFNDYGRGILHQFVWFAVGIMVLVVLAMMGIIKI